MSTRDMTPQRSDAVAAFLASPSRETLPSVFADSIGEDSELEYKENWPTLSKMAKHILGMANSGGGLLVVGVKELPDHTFDPVGLLELKDKTDILNSWSVVLPDNLLNVVQIHDFNYANAIAESNLVGKLFQLVLVTDSPHQIPYLAKVDTSDVKSNVIYVRKGPTTIAGDGPAVEAVINRRLSTLSSTKGTVELTEHLSQLRALYSQIRPYLYKGGLVETMEGVMNSIHFSVQGRKVQNPEFPEEGFEQFISKVIAKKKMLIERLLEVDDID